MSLDRARPMILWAEGGSAMSRPPIYGVTACALMIFTLACAALAQADRSPAAIFTQLGLTAQQRAAIDSGRPVAKVLSWGGPSEVFVLGAVYIDGQPSTYLKSARNVGRLAGTPGYLAIGELPAAPTAAGSDGERFVRPAAATRSPAALPAPAPR